MSINNKKKKKKHNNKVGRQKILLLPGTHSRYSIDNVLASTEANSVKNEQVNVKADLKCRKSVNSSVMYLIKSCNIDFIKKN